MARKIKGNIEYNLKCYINMNENFTQIPNDIYLLTNGNSFKVYCYLCRLHRKEFNYSFPSLNTIAKNTNISVRTVQNCIKQLEEDGLIKIKKQKNSEYPNNNYEIFVPIIIKNELEEIEEEERKNYIEEINKELEGKKFVKEVKGYFNEEEAEEE